MAGWEEILAQSPQLQPGALTGLAGSGVASTGLTGAATGAGAGAGGVAGILGSAAVPLAIAGTVGSLIKGIFTARAQKKEADRQARMKTAENRAAIGQQGVQQQNAALESLMRRL